MAAKHVNRHSWDLPTDPLDRAVYCLHYGDMFSGENDPEARSYARFSVLYLKGMKLGPYAPDTDGARDE